MNLRSIFSESHRNVSAGTTRLPLFIAVMLLILSAGVTADAVVVRDVYTGQRDFLASGGATTIIESDGAINAHRCTALSDIKGVKGSFAARKVATAFELSAMPGTSLSVREVSGDFVTTLGGVGDAESGVGIAQGIDAKIGPLALDTPLQFTTGTSTLSAIFNAPTDGRDERYSSAFFISTAPVGQFDECVLTVWPVNSSLEPLLYSALEPTATLEDVHVLALNASAGTPTTTETLLNARQTRTVPWIAAGLAFGAGILAVRTRRVELALALAVGVRKVPLAIQCLVESLYWILPASALGAVATIIIATQDLALHETQAMVLLILARCTALSCTAIGGVLLGAYSIRADKIYAWYKDR
jgi:hypothetical protein